MYLFRTPTVREYRSRDRLFRRISNNRASTVIKDVDGFYRTIEYASNEEAAVAAVAYLGGREYRVDDVEAAALTAAGYGAFLTELDVSTPVDPGDGGGGPVDPPTDPIDPPEFGAGAFGSGNYGD